MDPGKTFCNLLLQYHERANAERAQMSGIKRQLKPSTKGNSKYQRYQVEAMALASSIRVHLAAIAAHQKS